MLTDNRLCLLRKGHHLHPTENGRACLITLCFFLAFFASSCAVLPPVTDSHSSAARCLPSFPDKDGWYGGDGAYSIKLDDQRTLWLFGDTFVACEPYRKDRIGMDVVLGTTVAISTCSENGFHIDYYLKHEGASYVSFFGSEEWLWPQDPFILNGVLYIPLLVVRPTQETTNPFPFTISGHRFARIRDFSAPDPREWKYDYIDLSASIPREITAFAATSVVYGDYVYFYPLYAHESGNKNVVGNSLARIPAAKIEKPAGEIEYLSREGTWIKDIDPDKVKIILEDVVSELSVRYHPALGTWVAVYLSTTNRGERLIYQTAARPEGPWSSPMVLLEPIPEVDPRSALYDPNNFCYAGKEHIEFSDDGNIVATYVCNSFEDMNKPDGFIRRNLFLYRPVVREAALK
jgi:hypothetical protein